MAQHYSDGKITRKDFDTASKLIVEDLEVTAVKEAELFNEINAVKKEIATIEQNLEEVSLKPQMPPEPQQPPQKEEKPD